MLIDEVDIELTNTGENASLQHYVITVAMLLFNGENDVDLRDMEDPGEHPFNKVFEIVENMFWCVNFAEDRDFFELYQRLEILNSRKKRVADVIETFKRTASHMELHNFVL
jgi:hypothetical protein